MNTNVTRLFAGGCGTQVGLLLTCGALAAVLVVCSVCGATNFLTISLSQDVAFLAPEPTGAVTVTPTPPSAVLDSLLGQVRLLTGEMEFLRSNMQVVSLPTATPTPTPQPFLVANQSGINLRSGPGTEYNRVGVLPMGESIEIVGRNDYSSWWLVATADGMFAWVSADMVTANFVTESIPVVTIPSLLVWGTPGASTGSNGGPASGGGPASNQMIEPQPLVPQGTPTASMGQQRQVVEEMPAYSRLTRHLLIPPTSASISPHGDRIAVTERIKLYTVTTDGALSRVWIEDTDRVGPIGNLVWSPDGDYLALVVGYKEKYCKPCEGVAVIRLADGLLTYLEHPGDQDLNAPRWTQDGRLLVNAHPGEPADGQAYVYDVSGRGQPAQGPYVLSASHFGQRWYPWQPGKTWLVGSGERADSYNAD